ncbi:MAG: hypothetical protein A2508_09970 [Candidatus Lambdaproteobacteria bacterium RIFOXYD12_FULL_49_8]|uniref:STAS/SEC14 domain-containing protein n=1 Tax=Candidatus Lambdaproteobacteria bacterium RIFOXYD2_FULL_50_16 TaxID=1817772 RepID=A0A1F6GFE5_9PROT|nr:MAG: hypothetical protein A2527_00240 [Candidatus Lambdaproteobacteria bacterium RIFOXYD2_FULL_50_16]OGG97950.1 MAG: hypothetical protein A2508_09970 [Candidatus Lambdaproteobacteria bacterium RIFOXYD12_FULL_49_8]
MYQKLAGSAAEVLGYQISGRVTTEEIETVIKDLEAAIEAHGKIRLLVEMKHWTGMDPMAALEDLQFLIKHINQISHLAVIGDHFWERLLTQFGAFFVSTLTQYFEEGQVEEAWAWIKNG